MAYHTSLVRRKAGGTGCTGCRSHHQTVDADPSKVLENQCLGLERPSMPRFAHPDIPCLIPLDIDKPSLRKTTGKKNSDAELHTYLAPRAQTTQTNAGP